MIEVTVNTEKLVSKVNALAQLTDTEPKQAMWQEGRLFAVELSRVTQPMGFDKSARAAGEAAIERDFSRVYLNPLADSVIEKIKNTARPNDAAPAVDRYRAYIQGGALGKAEKMLRAMKVSSYLAVKANPALYMGRWVDGKLRGGPREVVLDFNTVARMKRKKKAKVGFAKAGWAACARQLGGTRGIPQWVTRHRDSPGEIVDRLDEKKPLLILRNRINYTSRVMNPYATRAAVANREFRLQKRIEQAMRARMRELKEQTQ